MSCVWVRHGTFQHSVYPVSRGLCHQPGNYVTQRTCIFRGQCVLGCRCMCWSVQSVSGSISLPVWSSVVLNRHDFPRHARTHTRTLGNKQPHLKSSHRPAALFLGSVILEFSGRPLCNLVNAGALHVGNVSETSTEPDWLPGHTPPKFITLPLQPNLQCSDARVWLPWQLPLQDG